MTEKNIQYKLNELPVPDMENIIWKEISGMLDTIPAGHSGYKGKGKNFRPYLIAGLIVFFIAILYMLLVKKKNHIPEQKIIVPIMKGSQPVKDSVSQKPVTNKDSTGSHIKKRENVEKPVVVTDSAIKAVILLPTNSNPVLLKDSNQVHPVSRLLLPPADSLIRYKKPKGVSGIKDSSYRITPVKKD